MYNEFYICGPKGKSILVTMNKTVRDPLHMVFFHLILLEVTKSDHLFLYSPVLCILLRQANRMHARPRHTQNSPTFWLKSWV